MLMDEFSCLPVQEAKPKVRASVIEQGWVFAYAEPENLVISHSADECVIALMDQMEKLSGGDKLRSLWFFFCSFFYWLIWVPSGC
jgi:leucyl-tRNA synthetase